MSTSTGRVTRLLLDYGAGEERAFDELVSLVYDDLRSIAHRHLRGERTGHTLNTTALVHEAYANLVDRKRVEWRDRAHFFAVASRVMRHILIDHARRHRAEKRGGDRARVPLEDARLSVDAQATELLDLDRALSELAERHPRMGRVVECRFFGGMTAKETAAALDVSERTVRRDWTRAKVYLHAALAPEDAAVERPEGSRPSE